MNESRPSLLPNQNLFLPRITNHRIMELPLHARLGFVHSFVNSLPSYYKQESAKFVSETRKEDGDLLDFTSRKRQRRTNKGVKGLVNCFMRSRGFEVVGTLQFGFPFKLQIITK